MSTEIKEPKTYADLQPGDLLYIESGHGHAKRTVLAFVKQQRPVDLVTGSGKVLVVTDEGSTLDLRKGTDYARGGVRDITKVTVIVLAEGGIYEEYEVTP